MTTIDIIKTQKSAFLCCNAKSGRKSKYHIYITKASILKISWEEISWNESSIRKSLNIYDNEFTWYNENYTVIPDTKITRFILNYNEE